MYYQQHLTELSTQNLHPQRRDNMTVPVVTSLKIVSRILCNELIVLALTFTFIYKFSLLAFYHTV